MSGIFFEALNITVPVVPIAQPRQKHRHVKTKEGKEFTMNYTEREHPVNTFKAALQLAVGDKMTAPLQGPVMLGVILYFPRTKAQMKLRWDGPIPHTVKPDTDNLLKAVKDALKGIAWRDDSQVFRYTEVSKYYCEKHGQARVCIQIIADAGQQSTLKGA